MVMRGLELLPALWQIVTNETDLPQEAIINCSFVLCQFLDGNCLAQLGYLVTEKAFGFGSPETVEI